MVSVVIGSWGSYNECNERALGSKWLDLSDYDDWEETEDGEEAHAPWDAAAEAFHSFAIPYESPFCFVVSSL